MMVCSEGEEWNFDHCNCVPVTPAPELPEVCCEMACADNFWLDCDTCTCLPTGNPPTPVCPMDLCWDGSSRNPADCSCPSCKDLVWVMDPCEVGFRWNYDLCRCDAVCMVKEPQCHRGFVWDEQECDCLELEKEECARERSCRKKNFGWDDEKCKCVEKCDIVSKCYAGYVWDVYKCDCVLMEEPECGVMFASCHEGFVWDQDQCECLKNGTVIEPDCSGLYAKCSAGYIWSEEECSCVEQPEICCMMACIEPGYELDCATCSCVPV